MQMSIQTINVSNNNLVAKAIGEKDNNRVKLMTGNAIIMTILVSMITILIVAMIEPVLPTLFKVDSICIIYLNLRLIGFI